MIRETQIRGIVNDKGEGVEVRWSGRTVDIRTLDGCRRPITMASFDDARKLADWFAAVADALYAHNNGG